MANKRKLQNLTPAEIQKQLENVDPKALALFMDGLQSTVREEIPQKIKFTQHIFDPQVKDNDGKWHKASDVYDKYITQDKRFNDGRFSDSVGYNPYSSALNTATPSANYFNNLNSLVINNFFVGYGQLSILAQNPLISNICDIRATECISKWGEFVVVGDGKDDKTDKIKQLEKWFKKFEIKKKIRLAKYYSFMFGGCRMYIKMRGDGDFEDPERVKPLLIDKLQISKGDIEDLKIIEPLWYTAVNWQALDPTLEDFYNPSMYVVLGKMTHATRLISFVYKEVPDILKPTYLFNGQPLSQELIPYLMGAEQSRVNINKLISKANHFVLGTNLEAIIGDQSNAFINGQNLGTRINMMNATTTNGNVVAIDKDTETFENISVNLGGLNDIQAQNIQYVCSIARIPVTKLFCNSLAGLNPTGEHETNNWYDTTRADQASIDEQMDKITHIAMLDNFGEIDDEIEWKWLPLEKANELEVSQINLNKMNELAAGVGSQILAPMQAAKILQADEDSGYNNLEIIEEDYMQQFENFEPESPDNDKEDK